MVQTISRMYADPAHAEKALDELRSYGYDDVHIFGPATGDQVSSDDLADRIAKAFILKSEARVYADRVLKGGTLVAVHAPFGSARLAREILDDYSPVDSGVSEPDHTGYVWDEMVPFSSAMSLPVLSKSKLPFEGMWGVPSVTRKPGLLSDLLGFSLLAKSSTPFSSMFGLSVLTSKDALASHRLGLPLLTR